MATSTKVLLPPYLYADAWNDLCEVMDEVLGEKVHFQLDAMRYLRDLFVADFGNPDTVVGAKVADREFLDPEDFDVFDGSTERLRLSHVGLKIKDPTILNLPSGTQATLLNSATHRLVQNIGMFWMDKGRGTFMDFIAYCLNTQVKMVSLWTKDYVNFLPADSPSIGSPVWNGGPWYPTTHVRLDVSQAGISNTQLRALVKLFYDIANYNLVLEGVSESFFMDIVDSVEYNQANSPTLEVDGTYSTEGAAIVGCALHVLRQEAFTSPFYDGPPY